MKSFRTQTLILIAIAFTLGMSEFIIIGVLGDIAHTFHVSFAQVGFLTTVFALIYAISTPILSLLIGKRPLKQVMNIVLGIFICGNVLSFLAPNFMVLTISRIITALVSGITISITITFATHIAPLTKRAWIVAWVFSGFSIASVFGVPAGTWLSGLFGWRLIFLLIAGLALLVLGCFELALPGTLRQQPVQHFSEQFHILTDRRILLGVLIPVFNLGGVYVVYTYVTPILTNHFGYSLSFVTIFLVLYGIASLLSNQYSGNLAANHGLQRSLKFYSLQLVALLLTSLCFNVAWVVMGAILIMGFTIYLAGSTLQLFYMSIAEADYPQSLVLASSFNPIFSNLGIAVGSACGSFIVGSLGMAALGFGGAALTAGGLFTTWYLTHHLLKKP
ncbi:MFS transporter [Fructilactobacillus myrtifloralis]|uniref:MFS transporter n=1 Tax=Fructilactobacillus myrtifloralis TaxID=2940301 RepID=A0ABY5BQJ6_9LACO|nr:MFS transporter [Fructilactobacillus myrtifloralis]USS85191.1 MFS transporter [Fructilactobacillus myrtifloralis]